MKVITEKELLDFCYKNAKKIAESQFFIIDEDYNIIQLSTGGILKNMIKINCKYEPIFTFEDNIYFISIFIKYNTNPITELNLIATKWIVKDGKYVDFEKVVP